MCANLVPSIPKLLSLLVIVVLVAHEKSSSDRTIVGISSSIQNVICVKVEVIKVYGIIECQ